jgi:thioredoxin reductase
MHSHISGEFPESATLIANRAGAGLASDPSPARSQFVRQPARSIGVSPQRSEKRSMKSRQYDVVVVGGGAAGLSAALVLGRARRRVAVVDGGSPRNASAAHMQGFLSRDGMPPSDFLAAGREEARRYDVELIQDTVDGIAAGFSVRLAGGPVLEARRILLATGVRDELPTIPGARERWGRDLLHCPYCHGWEVRDQPIGVLGTRADAVQHALLVHQWSDDTVFFEHVLDLGANERERLQARGVTVVRGLVARLVIEADHLVGVELLDGRFVPRTALFVRPVSVPYADGLVAGLGCDIDKNGFPVADEAGRTSTAGVWAAGNLVDPRLQVITSAGAGSAAAIAINADLVEDDNSVPPDRRDAVSGRGRAGTASSAARPDAVTALRHD